MTPGSTADDQPPRLAFAAKVGFGSGRDPRFPESSTLSQAWHVEEAKVSYPGRIGTERQPFRPKSCVTLCRLHAELGRLRGVSTTDLQSMPYDGSQWLKSASVEVSLNGET